MPRMFTPDERITVSLPARYVSVLMDMLRRPVPVVPYELLHPVISELERQIQELSESAVPALPNGPLQGMPAEAQGVERLVRRE